MFTPRWTAGRWRNTVIAVGLAALARDAGTPLVRRDR